MKKIYATLAIFLIGVASNGQIVNIPDAGLKDSLLNYSPQIDTNGDGEIQVSEAAAVTMLDFSTVGPTIHDLTGIEAFSNLTDLNCELNSIQQINVSSLAQLVSLRCGGNSQMSALDVTNCMSLVFLDCANNLSLNNLQVSNLPNLQHLNCRGANLDNLDLTNLPNLIYLNCDTNNLAALDLSGHPNLAFLHCAYNYLSLLDVAPLTNLTELDCSDNSISTLAIDNLTALTSLQCELNNLTVLGVGNLVNLLTLNCGMNPITVLNILPLVNLTVLNCLANQLGAINLSSLSNLTELTCASCGLSNLDLSTVPNLTLLDCSGNQLPNLDVSNLTQLETLNCNANLLTSLDVTNNDDLVHFNCAGNQLTALDITGMANLRNFNCAFNQLTAIDLSNSHNLAYVSCFSNLFSTLDFSAITTEFNYQVQFDFNPLLTYVNLKNGRLPYINIPMQLNCPNLRYVCADDAYIGYVASTLQMAGGTDVQVNSYCSFTPGGIHNTISGSVTLDLDNNGCDASDAHFPDIKVSINDGTTTGATFTTPAGNYVFYTQAGNYSLALSLENQYFSISPSPATAIFAANDGTTQTQNFCIQPVGTHNDLEITIIPGNQARPGFFANYTLSYKNKGNQTLSGNVNMAFNDALTDFVLSTPSVSNQSAGNLSWDFTNLQPFESRTIAVTLRVNAPTDTPPVNIGDVLQATASVNPVSGDETPLDNISALSQTVTGSFDPNDKICLEGDYALPEKIGDYLHYVIHFQNSGTAPAQNIVVKDIIDTTKFDMTSLQLTSSSYPQTTKITGDKAEFIFEDINLPPAIDNEAASHGYVAFKIKTKNDLAIGSSVSNTSDIYFDYNFPIETNTASTAFVTLATNSFEDNSVAIYPNPVKDKLTVSASGDIQSVSLFDGNGRQLKTQLYESKTAILNVAGNAAGVYFVKIYTEKGTATQKIIIK